MDGILNTNGLVLSPDSQLRAVVILAEMCHGDPLGKSFSARSKQRCRILIGQMATRPLDAPLERPGIPAHLEHFRIVVAFDVCRVHGFEDGLQPVERMPEVGQDAETLAVTLDDERYTVDGIMGRQDSVDGYATERERLAGLEEPHITEFS